MREKPKDEIDKIKDPGITPACAGKTVLSSKLPSAKRDHPRVCGKNCVTNYHSRHYLGSPPRVREKQIIKKYKILNGGITPACAGKTQIAANVAKRYGDHPRVCGKNSKKIQLTGQYYFKKWINLFTFVASNAVSLASSSALCGSCSMIPYASSTFSSL